MIVSIDFESRSLVELKKAGLRRYAEDYSTKILCMAWAIDDEEPEIWLPTQEFPRRLRQAVEWEAQFNAWNAQFEMEIWRQRSPSDWPKIADAMWHDTMGDAASCGFPLKLDTCAKAIGTEEKLSEGTRLINKLCKPKRDGTFWEYDECPKDFQALYMYCKQDVRAERSVFQSLPSHVEGAEDVLQRLTWTSNRRGVPIDVDSVNIIQKRLTERIEQVDRAVQKMTGGELNSARQRDKLLMNLEMNREASKLYVQDRELRLSIGLKNPRLKVSDIPGIKLSTTQSEIVEEVLKNWDLSEYDRELLGYQQDLRHASVAKFKKLKLQICNDDTVKDNIQFHGAGTGRDAGRGFQLQNLPRVTSSDPELLLSWFRKHGADVLDMLAPVLELASSLIRPMICAPAGMKLVVSDSGQIEARGTAWLVKEENILQDFRDGIDPYISQASAMYDIPMEEVTGIQRNYGKLAVLACIVEGQEVLTDHGLVPIEEVCTCMRVWDGVEWVHHEGAIYKGEKEVISYDGLQATRDHIVYTETGKAIELQEAARSGERIAKTGVGGTAFWYGGGGEPLHNSGERFQENLMPMCWVSDNQMDRSKQSTIWEDGRVPEMQPTETNSQLASEALPSGQTEMPEPQGCTVQELWRTRDRVPVQDSDCDGVVGNKEPGTRSFQRDRQNKEQPALRTWEPETDDTRDTVIEQTRVKCAKVPRVQAKVPRCKVCGHNLAGAPGEDERRGDSRKVQHTKLQTKRRVWDLLNAGPRHRFTVEGKLVSNCGFQGSHKALTKFAEGYGLVIERKTAVQVVKKFRSSRPRLVAAWSAFGEAAILAINDAGTPYQVHGCQKAVFQMQGRHLTMELPSGRKLWYPYANVEVVTVRYEDGETGEMKSFQSQSMTSMWVDSMTRKWARRSMSGGNLLQNWVQATCRDIVLREAVPRLEGMGYPIVARVHDEVICLCEDHPKYNVAEVDHALCVVPDWAEGLPLSAKGYESKRYRK